MKKIALKLILGSKYVSYENAMEVLNLTTLTERRKQICISFARKTLKNSKFAPWFKKKQRSTRRGHLFKLPKIRTTSYENSPLPYLTHLLNDIN